jgi:hypothetical protein
MNSLLSKLYRRYVLNRYLIQVIAKINSKSSAFAFLSKQMKVYIWRSEYVADEKILRNFWKPKYSKEEPLFIALSAIYRMNLPTYGEYHSFNPTIIECENDFKIAWRISDAVWKPEVNSVGRHIHNSKGSSISSSSGIAIGKLSKESIYGDQAIENFEILIPPEISLREEPFQSHLLIGDQFHFEDPRFFPGNPEILLLHCRYIDEMYPERLSLIPAIFNTSSGSLNFVSLDSMERTDKNWAPIPFDGASLKVIRSTEPLSIVTIDKKDFRATEEILQPGKFGKIHNASNLIQLENGYYIRVSRQRFNLEGLRGVHISCIVVHDKDLNEIFRTTPFIFQRFAYEVCNSILEYRGDILFLWGENDEDNYLGKINSHDLFEWIVAHRAQM